MKKMEGIRILAADNESVDKIGVISFFHEKIHHSMIVRLLNDYFGIQVRGGCSCAGTYGHFLLHVNRQKSRYLSSKIIKEHDLSEKPGWVRISLHPTMTDTELDYVVDAVKQIVFNVDEWSKEYSYNSKTNEFYHKDEEKFSKTALVEKWFGTI